MSEFYKRNPGLWMTGTDDLTLEQEAAYSRVIDATHLYDHPVRNNLRVLAGLWRCNERKAKRLLAELIALGKLTIDGAWIEPADWPEPASGDRPAIPTSVRRAVLARDGQRCVYCGSEGGPFHLDHVIPWSRGGGHDAGNLAVACAPCNFSKRDRTPEEWLQ